jgi:hypothetical protein
MQPADYRVTRTATMAAPVAEVFPQVNELQKWLAWSPWMELDPKVKNTFSGPPSGPGATFAWAGNSQVGEGKMTITETKPNELIKMRLEFFKPMAGTSDTEFIFEPEDNQTTVTWTMTGKNNFIGKAFCLFMNMDTMLGGQFDKGLASIKAIVEKARPK